MADMVKPIEPLVLESSYSLAANKAHPLLIEIYVPPGTAAGDYSASILIKNSGTTKITIPVTLTVHGFSLPVKSSDHAYKCYAQLGMTGRMGAHGETLNVAKMQKYVDDVCGVMYGMTDIGYIDKWFTYNTPAHYVNLRSLGGPIEGREPIDIILSHGAAKGYDEFYPPFGSFGYANNPPDYNPDPTTYFNGWTGDGTPVVGNENPLCDQAFMDTFNSLKARYQAYGADGKFPYYNYEEEDVGDVPGDHTKTILKRHFFDMLHNAGSGPSMGTGLDGPDDTYSLQGHLDYLFVAHLNTQLEKPNVSRIENLGFYHNGFHQGSTSLTHSLWHWRNLMMGFYLFGYRGGIYILGNLGLG